MQGNLKVDNSVFVSDFAFAPLCAFMHLYGGEISHLEGRHKLMMKREKMAKCIIVLSHRSRNHTKKYMSKDSKQ